MGTMLYRCSIGVWQTIHDGMSALTLGLTVLNHVETHIKDQERLVSIPILVDRIVSNTCGCGCSYAAARAGLDLAS